METIQVRVGRGTRTRLTMRNQRMFQRTFRMGGSFTQSETSLSLFCDAVQQIPVVALSLRTCLLPSDCAEPSGNRDKVPFPAGLVGSQGVGPRWQPWAVGMLLFPVCPDPCCLGFGPAAAQVGECGPLSWEIQHVPFLDEWAHLYCLGLRSINL